MGERVVKGTFIENLVLDELNIEEYNCVRFFDGEKEVDINNFKVVIYNEEQDDCNITLEDFKGFSSVVSVDNGIVLLSFDLSSEEEKEELESNFEQCLTKYPYFSSHIGFLDDESGEDTNWIVANVYIEYTPESDIDEIKNFINSL